MNVLHGTSLPTINPHLKWFRYFGPEDGQLARKDVQQNGPKKFGPAGPKSFWRLRRQKILDNLNAKSALKYRNGARGGGRSGILPEF